MPSKWQYLERKENIASILQHIRNNGPKTRRQLSCDLALSWGCISELVSILLQRNILTEENAANTNAKGRSPSLLSINTDVCFLGVDINLRGLRGCICNLLGENLASYSDTLHCRSKAAFITSVQQFVDGILEKHTNVFGIGFAIQGFCSADRNEWDFPGHPPFTVDFSADLSNHFSVPVSVDHDPNCILYGFLENSKVSKMIVRIDSGIGASIHINNDFFQNSPLELGYLVMNERGEKLHDILSLNAIKKHFPAGITPDAPTKEQQQFFENAGTYLGTALGNICNLFHLDEIYICGEMVCYYALFQAAMKQQYAKTVLPAQSAKIRAIQITDAAYGAAKMAMDQFPYSIER